MNIKLAGHIIGIDTREPTTDRQCIDYLTDEPAEVRMSISEPEMAKFDGQCRRAEREFYSAHEKVAEWLLTHDVLLFHGSCLALDGNGILFTAPSGTGKSTHARLWRERFGDRVVMINDDKPLIAFNKQPRIELKQPQIKGLHGLKISDNKKSVKSVQSVVESCTVYGSPWCGKEGIHTNTSAPLRCIVVLRQAAENAIHRLSAKEAVEHFLHQAYIPNSDISLRLKALDLVGRLAQLPVYQLGCTISQEAVALSYDALMNGL